MVGELVELAELVTPETREGDPMLEKSHETLRNAVAEIQRLTLEQNFHAARKQEATKQMNEILQSARRTATFLRQTLQMKYGPTSEQLAAYKIQPFRGRKRVKKAKGEASAAPDDASAPLPPAPDKQGA
jgi:hypothetical protein